ARRAGQGAKSARRPARPCPADARGGRDRAALCRRERGARCRQAERADAARALGRCAARTRRVGCALMRAWVWLALLCAACGPTITLDQDGVAIPAST